jgi:N-acetylmuramoyl-L-alanine amidase
MNIDGFQIGCAARTVWGEARGEGAAGMAAVAHVLLNRVKDGRWGNTLAAVCLAPWQFSCWNAGDPNRRKMLELDETDALFTECVAAVGNAPSMDDPTHGATHYYNPAGVITTPAWVAGATPTAKVGHHLFHKDVA